MKTFVKTIQTMLLFVGPLKLRMCIAIFFGVIGHLFAISIPVLGVVCGLCAVGLLEYSLPMLFGILVCNSFLRGVCAYREQHQNHYIAFKILAIIRDQVFTVLRKLCPAKLDGKNRGNLISLITSDIELLEVFYAHTISPTAIAIIVALIISSIMFQFHPIYALISMTAYICVGCVLPFLSASNKNEIYETYRNETGELSSYYLDSLRGVEEILRHLQGEERLKEIIARTKCLEIPAKKISSHEGNINGIADAFVLSFTGIVFITGMYLELDLVGIILPTALMMSSFGPTLSLSKLSVGLSKTLAAAKRVHALLEEEPEVVENAVGQTPAFTDIKVQNLQFSYAEETILKDINLTIENNKITSIIGKSGSGKSTLLKLIMRFWNAEGISISDVSVSDIETKHLRTMQSYMTQDSDIFSSSIMENIRVGKLDATDEEVMLAAKKASLDEFIQTLPNKYDTLVGELGDTLSGGEKQRIGLARAFLHDAPLLLLDEPTSNLDSLNESIILKSLKEEQNQKAIIIISHRASTLSISDRSFHIEKGCITSST